MWQKQFVIVETIILAGRVELSVDNSVVVTAGKVSVMAGILTEVTLSEQTTSVEVIVTAGIVTGSVSVTVVVSRDVSFECTVSV